MKFAYSLCLLLACSCLCAQNLEFKKYLFEWPKDKPDLIRMRDTFMNEDVVVIDESVKINVIDKYSQSLTKNTIVKINTDEGVKKALSLRFPETFDVAADKYYYQQGRLSSIKVPYIYKYKIIYYAARVMKPDGSVRNIALDARSEKISWIDVDGRRLEDYIFNFVNNGLEKGDILEYSYKVEFQGRYGYNLFYFHNETAKQNCTFEIRYSPVRLFEKFNIVNSCRGADSSLTINSIYDEAKGKKTWIYTYQLFDLAAINYPLNSRCGKQLPHLFIDFNFISFYGTSASIPDEAQIYADRGPKFEWLYNGRYDSLGFKATIYDKHHADIRKFISRIPAESDNTFYTLLCDSLNSQKFVTAEAMRYGDNAQYAVSSGEWLAKGKMMEEFLFPLYWDILNEKKKTTYFVKVQDKRLGEINLNSRAEYKYERVLFGVPNGKTIRFIQPRYEGLSYNSDELPFYMEAVDAALMGVNNQYFEISSNTSAYDFYSLARVVNFIRTPASTENENVRTESSSIKIALDSAIMHISIKESLNGQFSTILRPLYLNQIVDSTVNPVYFKKCTSKPFAKNIKIKNSFRSNVFPFKHLFNCSEDIVISNPKEISCRNWFAFTLNKEMLNGLPAFDYYLDFRYSDIYNFLLQFDKAVSVENAEQFKKSINNKYFELISNLVKQDESNYLLSVSVKVKQEILPVADGQLLLDFVKELDELNNAVIKFN